MKSVQEVTQELCQLWGVEKLVLRAECYEQRNGNKAFRNFKTYKGRPCFLPESKTIALADFFLDTLKAGEFYELNLEVCDEVLREQHHNPYLLAIDLTNQPPKCIEEPAKYHVEEIARSYLSEWGASRENSIGSMKRIVAETNHGPETFIYELIQNADDFPGENVGEVELVFRLHDQHMAVLHNGQPFTESNVYSICTSGMSDKEADTSKIGYKGLGFKSIFKDSNLAWIKSGSFSFRFDQKFIASQYPEERPWQVIPLWTNPETDLPPNMKKGAADQSPVAIYMRPRQGKEKLKAYEQVFGDVFNEERLLLFLRNIKRIDFKGFNSNHFFIERSSPNWTIGASDMIVPPEEEVLKLNQAIEARDSRVPIKYRNIQGTRIQYATKKSGDKILKTEKAKLFVFLPTSIDLGLPFLINGDFIPDAPRQRLISEIKWNEYILKCAGRYFPDWLGKLFKEYGDLRMYGEIVPSLHELKKENKHGKEVLDFIEAFEAGMQEGLNRFPCLPDREGVLKILGELVLDSTGIFKHIPLDFLPFFEKTGVLVHQEISSFKGVESIFETLPNQHIQRDDLKKLFVQPDFQSWLLNLENNSNFSRFLASKQWLSSFDDFQIFLNQKGTLSSKGELYKTFEDDLPLLKWTKCCCLHPDVYAKLQSYILPFMEYKPFDFIQKEILGREIEGLDISPENNLSFWTYINKHLSHLSENDQRRLKSFPVICSDGSSKPFESGDWFFPRSEVEKIADGMILPPNSIFIASEIYFKENGGLLSFWQRMGMMDYLYKDSHVLYQVYLNKTALIHDHYLHAEIVDREKMVSANVDLWVELGLFFDCLPSGSHSIFAINASKIPVLTTSERFEAISDCYLSHSYTGDEILEQLAEENEGLEVAFIDSIYLRNNSRSKLQWKILFENAGVKINEKQFIDTLIAGAKDIPDEDLIARTQFIFKNRGLVNWKEGIPGLRVVDKGGYARDPQDLFLDQTYKKLDQNSIIPSVQLSEVVSKEYLTGFNGMESAWADFFKNLGVKVLDNRETLLDLKLDRFIERMNTREVADSIHLANELAAVDPGLLEVHSSRLVELPLLTQSEGVFSEAKNLYFPSAYNPTVDFWMVFEPANPEIFISDSYLGAPSDVGGRIFSLLKILGVSEKWKVVNLGDMARQDVPPDLNAYFEAIDQSELIPAKYFNFRQTQHGIFQFTLVQNQHLLLDYRASESFWKSVDQQELTVLLTRSQYWVFNKASQFEVFSAFEWFIKQNPCIPCLDGQCHLASEVHSWSLKPLLEDSLLFSIVDFRIWYTDESETQNLESLLGIRTKLTLRQCIQRVNKLRDDQKLKEEKIWEMLEQFYRLAPDDPEWNNRDCPLEELPSQSGEWTKVKDIRIISDDFELGLLNSPWFVREGLEFLSEPLHFQKIGRKDFRVDLIDKKPSPEVVVRLKDRLRYVSNLVKREDWEEGYDYLQAKIASFKFFQVSKINLALEEELKPAIAKSGSSFYREGDNLYHVGNWDGLRARALFSFIYENVVLPFSPKISEELFVNLMIWELQEVELHFKEQNIGLLVPPPDEVEDEEQEEQVGLPNPTDPVKQPYIYANQGTGGVGIRINGPDGLKVGRFTPEEYEYLEKLFGGKIPQSVKEAANIAACVSALVYFKKQGFDISAAEENFKNADFSKYQALIQPVIELASGNKYTVMCRSAKGGILFLDSYPWKQLFEPDVWLFVKTGNGDDAFRLIKTPEQVIKDGKADYRVFRLDAGAGIDGINRIMDTASSAKSLHMMLRMHKGTEYDSIFDEIFEMERQEMDAPGYNHGGNEI